MIAQMSVWLCVGMMDVLPVLADTRTGGSPSAATVTGGTDLRSSQSPVVNMKPRRVTTSPESKQTGNTWSVLSSVPHSLQ
jgi:hypothetical protein